MNKKRLNKLLLLLMIVLILVCLVYIYINYFKKSKFNTREIDIIEEYNYKLYNNDTREYKELFNKLKKILNGSNIDEKEYLEIISQMFIIDFYTLDNKISSNDIGGTDFIYSKVLDNFTDKAKDTIYLNLESTKEKLPRVKKVNIDSINNVVYNYLNASDKNAYEVKASIKYKKDLGYNNEVTLYFVHEDKKLSLVEVK